MYSLKADMVVFLGLLVSYNIWYRWGVVRRKGCRTLLLKGVNIKGHGLILKGVNIICLQRHGLTLKGGETNYQFVERLTLLFC